jgi:gamma-butyrobetaine dioxygenase
VSEDPIDIIGALFANEGARKYFGEAVSVSAHMLQAGALAEADGAPDHLIAAALLHDVGHLRPAAFVDGGDDRHEESGAEWLAQWLPVEATEPVRLHVAAKRYLCATDPLYLSRLSPASVHTLGLQGGVMSSDEVKAFEDLPYAEAGVAVRRWDEAAKDPQATTPEFEHFRPMLERLMRPRY